MRWRFGGAGGRQPEATEKVGLSVPVTNWVNMVVIRNRIASIGAGGPRQFAELRNRVMAAAREDNIPEAEDELKDIGFRSRSLNNAPVIIAEPETSLEDVLERVGGRTEQARQAIRDIREAGEEEEGVIESTAATLRATQGLIEVVRSIGVIDTAQFTRSLADFGPENLRVSPREMLDIEEPEQEEDTLQSVIEDLNIPQAWSITRGENVAVGIFDTGFAEDLISSSRIRGTFSGGNTDSAFAPAEGHGTMCAGAAAANRDEGVPFDGVAPDADVFLLRITDQEGQIRTDIIADAWDWLLDRGDQVIVTNHSYGVPLCSTVRTPQFCNDSLSRVIDLANSEANITSCYAAGNEAGYCGHRLSGLTNGITSHNSLASVITVGALLSDGREAQRYSSHGRGDCAPRSDPKPNVSFRIPRKTYYGVEGGWTVKDMSTGVLGSSGGTSHASPMTCGAIALIQSAAIDRGDDPLQTEELKQVIEENSEPPRATQVNQFGILAGPRGWDARFGFGQLDVAQAVGG